MSLAKRAYDMPHNAVRSQVERFLRSISSDIYQDDEICHISEEGTEPSIDDFADHTPASVKYEW